MTLIPQAPAFVTCFAARVTRAVVLHALIVCLTTLALSVVTHTAHAQANATLAEALFDDGKRLFDAGDYDKACAKFKESQRLDPATGTLLNLAICYERAGRLATAWSTFREAASSARAANQTDREEHARDMANKLEGKLARLTIVVSGSNNLPRGFFVNHDGEAQPPAAWGVSLPVDAGVRHLEAGAPGFITWKSEVAIKDAQKLTVTVPILALQGTVAPVPPPSTVEEQKEPAPKDPPPSAEKSKEKEKEPATSVAESKPRNHLKTWGAVAISAGAVGLTVGSYFGIRALVKNTSSKNNCNADDPNVCSRLGVDERDQARKAATMANVFMGVGAAALTTGVVLLILSPKKTNTSVALAPTLGGGHLSFSGAF